MIYSNNIIKLITIIFLSTIIDVINSNDKFQISNLCQSDHSNCNKDELEYLAISELHDQIDDDKNGDIDISESRDFVEESLSSTQGAEKAKKFHKVDAHIDKQDLWNIWKSNEVYNWTTSDLINWLTVDVELPQYVNSFKNLQLNGSSISRLTGIEFLTNVVKIQNAIHRKKIMIKAVDLVLFGSQKKYLITNTSIVVTFAFFISIITYLFIQNIYSKRFVKTMQTKLRNLSKTEENLTELRNKLKIVEDIKNQKDNEIQKMAEKHKYEIIQALNSSRESLYEESDKSKTQQEILKLRSALNEAQMEINHLRKASMFLSVNNESLPDNHHLHLLLQLSYAVELQYLMEKIAMIDRQSAEFIELNEKVKKKKSAFLGSFRVIHSSDMDDIEKGFAATKRAYERVIFDKKELESRWSQIENITGFSFAKTSDISSLRQMIHTHLETVERQKREFNSAPSFPSNNDLIESSTSHSMSEIHGTPKSEKSSKISDHSMQFSVDITDQRNHLNSYDSVDNKSFLNQTIDKSNEDLNVIKRSRKDHLDKKRNFYKAGRTRIPSLTRSSTDNSR